MRTRPGLAAQRHGKMVLPNSVVQSVVLGSMVQGVKRGSSAHVRWHRPRHPWAGAANERSKRARQAPTGTGTPLVPTSDGACSRRQERRLANVTRSKQTKQPRSRSCG